MNHVPLAVLERGGTAESVHSGSAVIARPDGTVREWGDAEGAVFPRSAIKAIQALPLVETGAADRWRFDDAALALACASHGGEPDHVAGVASMLEACGLDEAALGCGTHWPSDSKAARALAASGGSPSQLHNNCSGKHAGFLATARHLGEDVAGYVERAHPAQRRWIGVLAELAAVDPVTMPEGRDGCSIPTLALPLRALATAFARFAMPAAGARGEAAALLSAAIVANPFRIAGTGRFCTRMIEATRGEVLVKVGAEGVFAGWLPGRGLGFALKVADGGSRAAEVACAAVIRACPVVSDAAREAAAREADRVERNWRGFEVGRLRAVI